MKTDNTTIDMRHANCLSEMDRMIADGVTVDLIVTDPPYLVEYKTGWRKTKGHRFSSPILGDSDERLIEDYIDKCYDILKDDGAMYLFCSAAKVDFFKQQLERKFTLRNMIIWVKNNHTAGDLKSAFGRKYEIVFLVNKGRSLFRGKRLTDVWEFPRVPSGSLLHQNQKPLALIERCVEKHSDVGDLVFDGFAGSGTTAVACANLGRNFVGCELDDGYYEVAKTRIERHTKRKEDE